MGRARDPGWGKRRTGTIGRHGYGKNKDRKPAAQAWMKGQQAKELKRVASERASTRSTAEETAGDGKSTPQPCNTAASSRKAAVPPSSEPSKVANRKRFREHWDKTGGVAKAPRGDRKANARQERAAAAAALPKNLGAQAATRHEAFASEGRSADAARQSAEYHERQASKHLKKLARKDPAKAAATLGAVNRDPELRPLLPAAAVQLSEDVSLDRQLVDNAAELVEQMTADGRGNRSYDARGVDVLLTALVSGKPGDSPKKLIASSSRGRRRPSPPSAESAASSSTQPSVRAIAKRLQMKQTTASRKLKKARQVRRALNAKEEGAYLIDWSRRVHRAGRCTLTQENLKELVEWVSKSSFVRTMPDKKHALLVRGSDGKKNVLVPRLVCEVGLTKLYLKAKEELPWVDENVKERKFRQLMPSNLRRMTARLESCGNPRRLKAARLHQALCIFRRKHKARLVGRAAAAYQPPDHADVEAALADNLPPECQTVMAHMRPVNCWMRRGCKCGGIRKRYRYPVEEKAKGRGAPTITFSTYEYQVQGKTRKGLPRKVHMLVKKTLPIGEFMEIHYVPMLEDTDYHLQTDTIIRYCEKGRHHSLQPGDADDERDFGEKISDAFEDAAQSDHWVNRTVTEEASITRSYPPKVCHDFVRERGAFTGGSTAALGEPPKDHHDIFLSDYEKNVRARLSSFTLSLYVALTSAPNPGAGLARGPS